MPLCSCWCWCWCYFFFFHFQSIFEKAKSNFWRITEWLLRWKLHSTHSSKQASTKKNQKILSFKYTLRHFHEVHQMCEQFTFKTFNNECKTKLKIFLFQYREYLDLKQHVDQLRNKQKHLRSQRDVSNIQSL